MSLQKNRVDWAMTEMLRNQEQRRASSVSTASDSLGSIPVKLYIEEPESEIRRFNLDAAATYDTLRQKVKGLLGRDGFRMFWQDAEGDYIVCESNDEFVAARQNCVGAAPMRIYIRASNKRQKTEGKAVHTLVTCDGCQGEVAGTRYKCLECEDYDLCEACEGQGKHEHDMLAIRVPNTKDWKKVFNRGYGSRHGSKEHTGRRHHGGHHGPAPGREGEAKRGCPPQGPGYGMFVPPFIKETFAGFGNGMEKTVEMDVDMNRPIHEILAEIAKAVKPVQESYKEAVLREMKETTKPPQVPVEELVKKAEEAAVLAAEAAVVAANEVEMVTEKLKEADISDESVEVDHEGSDGEWTKLGGETVAEDKKEFVHSQPDTQKPETESGDGRIEMALRTMEEMGFANEGNLLRRLLVNYNGDISRVLDSIK